MPGIKTDKNGKLILKPASHASTNFAIEGSTFVNTALIPRPKFLFFVRFVKAQQQPLNSVSQRLNSKEDGIVFQIKNMDLPKFKVQTEKMNQYNKVRIAQTKIEYDTMTIDAHDDVSDRMLRFWTDYYTFYYGQGRKSVPLEWQDDVVRGDFNEGQTGGWGYIGQFGQTGGAQGMHYLQSIEVIRFYGKLFNKITFVHPYITSFDHDGNDVAEGREGSSMRVQFEYEGVIYSNQEQNINNPEFSQLRDQLGFANNYFDPDDPNALTTSTHERGAGSVDDLTGGVADNFTSGALTDDLSQNADTGEGFFDFVNDSVLSGVYDFGSSAYKTVTESISGLTNAIGLTSSPDIVARETGVKNQVDMFGNPAANNTNDKLTNLSSSASTGIDSRKVSEAASVFGVTNSRVEQKLDPGISAFSATTTQSSKFSNTLGNAAALAKREGLVGSIASNEPAVSSSSAKADAVVTKLPSGNYRLTSQGASVMNTLRDSTSSIGSRLVGNPFENPNNIDSGKRTLAALTGGLFGNK